MELLDGDGREKSWEIKRKIRELLLTLLTLRLPVQLDFVLPPHPNLVLRQKGLYNHITYTQRIPK